MATKPPTSDMLNLPVTLPSNQQLEDEFPLSLGFLFRSVNHPAVFPDSKRRKVPTLECPTSSLGSSHNSGTF